MKKILILIGFLFASVFSLYYYTLSGLKISLSSPLICKTGDIINYNINISNNCIFRLKIRRLKLVFKINDALWQESTGISIPPAAVQDSYAQARKWQPSIPGSYRLTAELYTADGFILLDSATTVVEVK